MNVKKQFSEGLVTQNPALVQLLGMCPLLAITTSLFNGLGMGVMVIAVLTCSNVVIPPCGRSSPARSVSPATSSSSPALLPWWTC